jgi:hypothetical protein
MAIKKNLHGFFFTFQTERKIVIQNKFVAITFRLTQLLILVYIIW